MMKSLFPLALCLLLLGNGHTAGVQAADAAADLIQLHMGMTGEEHASLGQGRQIVGAVVVAVGQIKGLSVHQELRVICHAGEGQHHLVHLGFAVAPHAAELRLQAVQQRNDLFRGIFECFIISKTS